MVYETPICWMHQLIHLFIPLMGSIYHPTLQAMAAHFAFSLIKNHPFLDGNKRIGMLSMLVFLEINNLPVTCTDSELVSLGLGLADSSITESELVEWIISHS